MEITTIYHKILIFPFEELNAIEKRIFFLCFQEIHWVLKLNF